MQNICIAVNEANRRQLPRMLCVFGKNNTSSQFNKGGALFGQSQKDGKTFCLVFHSTDFLRDGTQYPYGADITRKKAHRVSEKRYQISDPVTNAKDWNWISKRNVFLELEKFTYK